VPVVYMRTGHFIGWIIAAAAISLMIVAFMSLLVPGVKRNYHRLFTYLNGTIFFVMITVISDFFFRAGSGF